MPLDAYLYRDPAEVVERLELDALGCEACRFAAFTFIRPVCTEPRNKGQKGVPSVGHRCKWFVERDAKEMA